MSHFSRIKTQMTELEYLTQALSDLDCQWETGDLHIGGLGAGRRKVEIKVKTNLFRREVGFVKSSGGYEIVADWWGISKAQRDKFRQELAQRYAYHAARAKLEAQGFGLVTEEKQPDGSVRLVLRRMTS